MNIKSWFGSDAQQQMQNAFMLRIKSALDSTSTNIMIADADRNIVYMNKAVEQMLREAESDLKASLPHFSVDSVVGSNMDIFHKNPSHQNQLLARLKDTYVGNIQVTNRHFRLIANPIFAADGERLGTVVEWQDRTKEIAAEHELSRILGALDTTSTNIMIADNDRKIIYINSAVEKMLRLVEADLRQELPHFSVDKIVGSNMDVFHKNPSHQMNLLSSLTKTHTANIQVGRLHFRLIVNPINSESGERLGSVVEWLDRTQEVGIENEVSAAVEAAGRGDFTTRIDTANKTAFFLKLAEGLNALLNTTQNGLNDINQVLSAISEGDLSQRVTGSYGGSFEELKNGCNETAESLSEMIGAIRSAADVISTAAKEIAVGNTDLSSRTEEQASSLEETASSMEELTSTVKQNADNARQANILSSQASKVAAEGGDVVQQVVSTMSEINHSAQKIADIIGVIDGIAFQTNILALNAAVEAARAGDQGRGFAVVASEVRTLAQRSANAAKDIKQLISDSVSKIERGDSLVKQAGNTMQDVVTSIQRVTDINAEISAASEEQARGIENISVAVNQMDEMTQQNAALVEEAAAAAESQQSQAEELNLLVTRFRINIQQTGRPALLAPASAAAPRASGTPRRIPKPQIEEEDDWGEF
ncbi:methyl-accepting chemotaxis protein [Nitrincola alkalilacustris]|uniref:methyl-accepting chemotaxis protein n=1 Tax=Nitrincola alkalilacustris TaxID=1571224 RepID=UPI00124D633D|nr:methyl-accepting chemotaxis protein [Nitrincola alkalilacustris]